MWQFLKDLEIEIPSDPAIPFLRVYPKDYKSFYYKDTCMCMFIAELFTIAKTWNQSKSPSITVWTRKMWHIWEYYEAIKHNEFVSCRAWINVETIILNKLTQEPKIKHCMFSLIGRC